MNTTLARQAVLAIACAALAGAVAVPAASASEPRPTVGDTGPTAYSDPLAALDGDCLATYLARHQQRVWGPTLF
jgi:hypothetical protein